MAGVGGPSQCLAETDNLAGGYSVCLSQTHQLAATPADYCNHRNHWNYRDHCDCWCTRVSRIPASAAVSTRWIVVAIGRE